MLSRTWIAPRRDLLAVAVVASLVACGDGVDPNQAPSVANPIPDQLMTEGDTVTLDLSSYFTDADGDALTYKATASTASVLAATVSGSRLTLVAVAPGTATVTVTATDPDGLEAKQDFDATVERRNRAPTLTDSIPERELVEGETVMIDLALHFEDPDDDSIMYEATSSDEDVLTVAVSGNQLSVTGVRAGTATVTVTASDPGGLSASQDFGAVVEENRAPEVDAQIEDVALEQDEYVIFMLSSYFSDPDDHPLTYTAVPSDTLVASASIGGDTLKISSGMPESTDIEVTATDPGGLSASQTLSAEIDEGFSVEFGDLDTLAHWRVESQLEADLSDDGLRLTVDTAQLCFHTYKRIRPELSEWWSMKASIGREDTLAAPYVMVGTDDSRYQGYRLLIGSGMLSGGQPANYRLDVKDNNFQGTWIPITGGFSDELDELGYELNEVKLEYSASSDTLVGRVDTIDLVTLELGEEGYPAAVATGDTGFGLCNLARQGNSGATALVESGHFEGGGENGRREYRDMEAGAATGAISETVRLRAFPSTGHGRAVEWPRVSVPATPARGRRARR